MASMEGAWEKSTVVLCVKKPRGMRPGTRWAGRAQPRSPKMSRRGGSKGELGNIQPMPGVAPLMNLRTLRLAGASLLSMGAILCTGIVDTPDAAVGWLLVGARPSSRRR